MHRDYWAGNKIEATSLAKFVVEEGLKKGVKTPLYEKISTVLLS